MRQNPVIGKCLICGKEITKYYPNSHHRKREGKGCCKSHSMKIACQEGRVKPPNPKHSTGAKNTNWKGGKAIKGGYIYLLAPPDHPIRGKKNGERRYIAEHRFVMEKHLGRYLQNWEKVHHKNSVKTDNRIENLELITDKAHRAIHNGQVKCPHCQKLFVLNASHGA